MTAKAMFEELEYHFYTCYDEDYYCFGYQKIENYKNDLVRNIHFDNKHRTIGIFGEHISKSISCGSEKWLSLEEFKAIQQQIKELGWESDK